MTHSGGAAGAEAARQHVHCPVNMWTPPRIRHPEIDSPQSHTHTYTHIHTYTHTHTQANTRTHTQTSTHTYTYTTLTQPTRRRMHAGPHWRPHTQQRMHALQPFWNMRKYFQYSDGEMNMECCDTER
eukprot:GHVU01100178.1.p2 GENE.GHVU01100178.1~~GHVU01100178.1.p2  ORF type:complete len:127 (+),score=15.51 GHVU01100178.1:280-660(+)